LRACVESFVDQLCALHRDTARHRIRARVLRRRRAPSARSYTRPRGRERAAYILRMENARPLREVPDDELLRSLERLIVASRRVESELVAHIAEVDGRRLYARAAAPSMFVYCTDVLHLSEAEAYLRIAAARASREHPMLLVMLADGRLHLSAIAKLAPHLTRDNREALLARAAHRSKRQVEDLVAELVPRLDAPAVMRKLPQPAQVRTATEAPELRPDAVARGQVGGADDARVLADDAPVPATDAPVLATAPHVPAPMEVLAPARYKVQFTASAELHDKLERLRALMRSKVPDGDLAAIIAEAVTEKLERLEARRFGSSRAPRKTVADSDLSGSSRRIPAAVRRAVRKRDGSRCRFVDAQGRHGPERHRLEFHHRRPFALGGDHRPDNVVLMCRAHNRLLAEHDYGAEQVARHIGNRGRLRLEGSLPLGSSG